MTRPSRPGPSKNPPTKGVYFFGAGTERVTVKAEATYGFIGTNARPRVHRTLTVLISSSHGPSRCGVPPMAWFIDGPQPGSSVAHIHSQVHRWPMLMIRTRHSQGSNIHTSKLRLRHSGDPRSGGVQESTELCALQLSRLGLDLCPRGSPLLVH